MFQRLSFRQFRHLTLIAVLASTVLAGCTVVKSERATLKKNKEGKRILEAPKDGKGIVYYLPQRLMRVKAERTATPKRSVAQAEIALANAEAALDVARKKLKEESDKVAAARSRLADAQRRKLPAPAISALQREVGYAVLNHGDAEKTVSQATEGFDTAFMQLRSAQAEEDPKDTIKLTLELLPTEPDPDHIYYARPRHQPLRDDLTKINVNERGLLTSSHVESTDRTGDILVQLAGAAGTFFRPSLGALAFMADTPVDDKVECRIPVTYEWIFDPTVSEDIKKLNHELGLCFERQIFVEPLGGPSGVPTDSVSKGRKQTKTADTVDDSSYADTKPDTAYSGYVYRAVLPYTVSVLSCASGVFETSHDMAAEANKTGSCSPVEESQSADRPANPNVGNAEDKKDEENYPGYPRGMLPEKSVVAMLPNEGPIGYIPIKSSFLVKTVNDVTFKDGAVVSWERNRPSELLEFVRLPVEMAKAVVSVPAELIQLRVNLQNEQTNLIKAQQAQIEANEALRNLQACIDQASSTEGDVSACLES
ncbi:MAG: hypothetical protein MI755_20200 [Sphingomonadales bacterium]|nr:hypothetical protein [Sphingomonadales bacterium]